MARNYDAGAAAWDLYLENGTVFACQVHQAFDWVAWRPDRRGYPPTDGPVGGESAAAEGHYLCEVSSLLFTGVRRSIGSDRSEW